MVGVEVAEEHGVDGRGVGVPLQRAERPAAEVQQDPPGAPVGVVGLDEVAAGRGVGAGEGPRAADDGEPHESPPANWAAIASSGPRKRRPMCSNSSGAPVVRKEYDGSPPERAQVAADEQLVDVLGTLLGAADEGHVVTDDVGDHAREQGVVGAAEDQRVDPGSDQRVEVVVGDREQLLAAGDPVLDEVDEPGAGAGRQGDLGGGGERVVVGERLGGGLGADHADPAVAGGRDRTPGRREDHLDDGHVVPLACVAEHRRAGGVAGDHQGLDALVDQVVEALEGVLTHLADRLGAVGLASGVTEIARSTRRAAGRSPTGPRSARRTPSRRCRSARRRSVGAQTHRLGGRRDQRTPTRPMSRHRVGGRAESRPTRRAWPAAARRTGRRRRRGCSPTRRRAPGRSPRRRGRRRCAPSAPATPRVRARCRWSPPR